MIAYFARRIVGGVVTLFLAGLVIYSLVVYRLGGIIDSPPRFCHYCTPDPAFIQMGIEENQQLVRELAIDKPWPINYIAWLFDPSETTWAFFTWHGTDYERQIVTKGINLTIGDFTLAGSGIVTADFGYSLILQPDRPVLDLFGTGLGEFVLLLMLILPASIGLVGIRRRGRPIVYGLPNFPKSRAVLEGYLRLMKVSGM
ncbi:MAG TPA: hypothetical protein VJ183_18270 [Chloroflexia bacterium]|nr:hypothetical protein [Chloroflexia bacterium]